MMGGEGVDPSEPIDDMDGVDARYREVRALLRLPSIVWQSSAHHRPYSMVRPVYDTYCQSSLGIGQDLFRPSAQ